MTLDQQILILTLARGDACHLPKRAADWALIWASQAIDQARAVASASGVPLKPGDLVASRGAIDAALERLQRDGLVVTARRLKLTLCRLTEVGDVRARDLAGLPDLLSGYLTLREVSKLAKAPGGLVSECCLANCGYESKAAAKTFTLVESMALPALSRGWITSQSDTAGRVYYHTTEAGLARLAQRSRPPERNPDPHDPEAVAAYDAELVAYRAAIRGSGSSAGNRLGELPLPSSISDDSAGEVKFFLPKRKTKKSPKRKTAGAVAR